jgi:hypothetical protein
VLDNYPQKTYIYYLVNLRGGNTMADSEEIKEAIADRLLTGVEEKQIDGRRTRYADPEKAYRLAKQIEADQDASLEGPFLKVRLNP